MTRALRRLITRLLARMSPTPGPVVSDLPDAPPGPPPDGDTPPAVDYRRSPSAACIRLIRDFEGLSLTAYRCAAGVWTIGYGHTEGVKIGDRVTGIKAEVMLREDLDDTAARVAHLLRRPVKQGQFDALVSFAFNVGAGALESSTLLQRLNAGDIEGAADEFLRWRYATVNGRKTPLMGLERRRRAERRLFMTGEYP